MIESVQSHLGLGERPVAQIVTTSPQLAMAQALGAAAGDAVGMAAGAVLGAAAAVVGGVAAADLTPDRDEERSAADRLRSASEVLLVLSTKRLLAFTPSGGRLLAALDPADLAAVTIEPSTVSPTNAVLSVRLEGSAQPIRLEGSRGSVNAFAELLSTSLGPALEHRPSERWFLLKAAPVGLLYTYGGACLLLLWPVAADGGAGPALQVGAMGAIGVAGGEGLRRRLFGRRPWA